MSKKVHAGKAFAKELNINIHPKLPEYYIERFGIIKLIIDRDNGHFDKDYLNSIINDLKLKSKHYELKNKSSTSHQSKKRKYFRVVKDDKLDSVIESIDSDIDNIMNGTKKMAKPNKGIFDGLTKSQLTSIIKVFNPDINSDYDDEEYYPDKTIANRFKRYSLILRKMLDESLLKFKRKIKPKVIPKSKQVAKLKYLPEFPSLSLKSVNPTKIIGLKYVLLYNVKLRKMTFLQSNEGGFSVSGTTIQNVNFKQSVTKTLRNPEKMLLPFFRCGYKQVYNELAKLTTKNVKSTGRTSDSTIIMRVFN